MARTFNGTNQYGQVARNYSAYSTLSVGGKVNFTSKPSPYGIIWEFTADGGSNVGGFTLYWNNSVGLTIAHRGNTNYASAEFSSATINNGQWYDLIAVYDFTLSTNEVNLYIDGVLQTASARPGNANNSSSDTYASSTLNVAVRNGASLYSPISMERLWIYGGSINADQAVSVSRGASPVVLLGAGLVDYWPVWGNDSPEPNYLGAGNITLTNTPTQAAGPSANRPFDGANWWPGAFTGTSPPPPPPSTYIGARFQMIGSGIQQFSGGRAA